MAQRMFTTLVIVATVFTVAIGCARTSARTSSTPADSTPAASPSSASTDLVGTWHGSAWELAGGIAAADRKSTRLNSSHLVISYAVFCLKKKKKKNKNSINYN